ncbi:MAG: glycosyl transferase [Planctomycetes bacterium RBG_16_55_9]|nr:MAG: glycosyl transferase [Planctomycetes bacterium RBG_16_55_9]
MRIAFYAWESLHSIPVVGVAAHVTEMAAALQRRGHEVHVFTRLGQGQSTYQWIDGVHYHRCPIELHPDFVTETNNMCNSFVYFMKQTESFQGAAFDVVHGHDWLCAKGIVQLKNNDGRRVLLTLHSTEYGRCGNHHFNGQSDRVRAVEAEGTHRADRVIAVSGALCGEIKAQYHVPDAKLRCVRNGINCARFDGFIDPSICRASYGIGPMDPTVLFVGRLTIQKGPDLLLEAVPGVLAMRPDAKVVFAGDGYMRGALEHRANELGVRHAVRFLGSMSGDGDLINLYKSADVVCVPSRNEPFGIVVLEAWAAGKPVVVTRNGGPVEMVTHNHEGLVAYDNPGSICWALKEIFSNFPHARWMGERGRVKAAYGFSWDVAAAQTEGIYRELPG